MSSLLASLDLYLSTASTAGLITYASLGIITVGLGPFALAELITHVAAARRDEVL